MTHHKKYLISILFLVISVSTFGQILSINENNRGKKKEISIDDKQIIDINSKIEVKVSKKELLKHITSNLPQYASQADLDEKIILFEEALSNQSFILSTLEKKVNDIGISDQKKLFNLLEDFLTAITENSILDDRYNELNDEFFSSREDASQIDPLERQIFIFSNLNRDLSAFREEIKQLESDVYSVSLVAYKKDKQGGDRVHIQNYDHYTEREHVTIDRWVTTLTDTQKKKLVELADQAKENNEKTISIFNELKQLFKANFPSISCISEQKIALLNFIQDPTLSDAVKEKGAAIGGQLQAFMQLINTVDTQIDSWEITTPFLIGDQFKELLSLSKQISVDYGLLDEVLKTYVNLSSRISELSKNFLECVNAIKNDLESLRATLVLLKNQQSNYILHKEIGKEVIAFSVDNLPETGFINLKGTGSRENGDELLIEIVLRIRPDIENVPIQNITLEQRTLIMQLIGARTEVTVGLIMANPTESDLDFEAEREFYFAPSAALLLKFGSRNSYFYNDFIDMGIGVNFASPDFNTDGTPEFGVGVIGTLFKDILSIGYNYNVTLDATYWFFGVNLPFNIPGIPINSGNN